MKNIGTIFRFEFVQQFKKKAVIVTTVILSLIAFALPLIPVVVNKIAESNKIEEKTQTISDSVEGGFVFDNEALQKQLPVAKKHLYANVEDLNKAVKKGKEPVGYVIHSINSYTTVYNDKGLRDNGKSEALESILKQLVINVKLQEKKINRKDYQELQSVQIQSDFKVLGRDTATQYLMAYIFMILMYIIIIFYGQTVATAVAREKDNRTMELLITTADPKELIVGKVLAITLSSVAQFAIIIASFAVSFMIFSSMYPAGLLSALKMMMNFSLLGMYILYFILGLFLYMFIFSALGSVVSKLEDLASAIMPVTFLFVAAYIISTFALQGQSGPILVIGSWIPFFSVMVMPIRYALTSVSLFEILGSTAFIIVFICLFAYISIRIYRWGTLNYGNKTNFFKVCKEVFFNK